MSGPSAVTLPALPAVPLTGVLEDIDLSAIVSRPDLQPRRDGLEAFHIEQLKHADWDAVPPPVVTPMGPGVYGEVGGRHTIAAARALGFKSLPCRVVEGATYVDAFNLDTAHGLSLTTDDRKLFARRLHGDFPDLSLRELGRLAGLHHNTVKAALQEIEDDAPEQKPAKAREPRPLVDRLVTLVMDAMDAKEGVGLFGKNKRAPAISKIICEYEDEFQPEIAEALHTWGVAMQEAALPFIKS